MNVWSLGPNSARAAERSGRHSGPGSRSSVWDAVFARLTRATRGEFEIVREVGRGAMGAVYLAKDVALSRKVAIKVISPQLLADENMVARFRLEARTVASLRNPHIVTIHAVRALDDLHYFIMDFVEGCSLRAILKGSWSAPDPCHPGPAVPGWRCARLCPPARSRSHPSRHQACEHHDRRRG